MWSESYQRETMLTGPESNNSYHMCLRRMLLLIEPENYLSNSFWSHGVERHWLRIWSQVFIELILVHIHSTEQIVVPGRRGKSGNLDSAPVILRDFYHFQATRTCWNLTLVMGLMTIGVFGVGFKEDGHPLFCGVSAPGEVIVGFWGRKRLLRYRGTGKGD